MSETSNRLRAAWLQKSGILTEALPYMRRYAGSTFVIKYGGHAMVDPELANHFARDIVLLKQVGMNPVIVHGGGPQIGAMLKRMNVESEFVDGLRVTDEASVGIVEMVLSGQINKHIVAAITAAGGRAIGISGKDGGMVLARRLLSRVRDAETGEETERDIGFVGTPTRVDPGVLDALKRTDFIPVISPIGYGEKGETYNINADTVAGAIAVATGAKRLLLLTDVEGVLDKTGSLISEMNLDAAHGCMRDGSLSGGMIPKVETCIQAIQEGVEAAVIVDGRIPHAILLEFFTSHGSGTMIRHAPPRG